MSKRRGEWKRYWLINRRADWHHVVMTDPDVLPQDKVTSYAIAASIDERTLDTLSGPFRDQSQAELARFCGMKVRAFRDALHRLAAADYLEIIDRGRLANGYRALFPDEFVGRSTASQNALLSGDAPPNNRRSSRGFVGRSTASQNGRTDALERELTSDLWGDGAHLVGRPDVICGATEPHLWGDRSPHLNSKQLAGYSGAASGGAPPSVSDNDQDSELRSGDQSKRPELHPDASRSRPGAARFASGDDDDEHASTAPGWDDDDIPF